VRGAPLIASAAAMGLVAATREQRNRVARRLLARAKEFAALLGAARPTAVNLRWALARMLRVADETPGDAGGPTCGSGCAPKRQRFGKRTERCAAASASTPHHPRGRRAVLTHCNTGALATGASAPHSRRSIRVRAGTQGACLRRRDSTLLQGSRLTMWELVHAGISCTLITDSSQPR